MAIVREDVVKVGFEFDDSGIKQANNAVDDLLESTQELGGSNGTGKAEDGFEDAAKAAEKFGKTNLSKLSDGIDKIVDGVGKFALKMGIATAKTVAAGAAAATAGIVALGTQAIKSYAEYEQLVGGVETLFGAGGQTMAEYAKSVGKSVTEVSGEYKTLAKSQETVFTNANNAYKTAGLSANDYMSTVTSFSASLVNSLGGDTMKAAEMADMAIIDMADNANKMGTDMTMIQNAYQGFAKQNYTMLDNLKLGYGGTQEEMKRLLKDAEKLTGKKYDISNFADVTEAIHAIQVEMGIAGTTAKEASETIQGSALAMKAAWQNFVTGMADDNADFDQLLDNLLDSVRTFLKNIIPRIKKMLPRMVRGMTEIAKEIGKELPGIMDDLLPALVEGAADLLGSMYNVLKANAGTFKTIGLSIIRAIYKGFTGEEMPEDMLNTIKGKIDEVVEAAKNILSGLIDFGKKLMQAIGPALLWIADVAVVAFCWIGENIDWLLPILGSLLGAMLAFKAVKKVTGIVQGFMGLFSLGGGKKGGGAVGEALGGGSSGSGFFGTFANMKPGVILKALGNIAIIVGGLTAIAALLMWAAPYLSELTDVGSFGKLIAAIAVVGVVGTALTKLTASVGVIPVATVTKGLADIAIIMVGMGALAFVLGWASSKFDFDIMEMLKLLGIIAAVGLVGSALAGLAGLVGAIPIPVVLTGLANIALALGGIAAVIAAFGALSKIDGFSEFIDSGGQLLADICGIIGEMAGSLIGGIGEGITNSLPDIGTNLSDFAANLKPMFDTFAGVNTSQLTDFAGAMAAFIAVIAGEKIVSVITGSIDYAGLGTKLSDMATNLSGFFTTIMAFPDEGFAKATALFDCLAGISSMPKEGGVVGWFEGEVDYAAMALGLRQLATAAPAFTAIQAIPDEAFAKMAALFECLVGIKSLPKDGGVVGWFAGEVNFANLASGIQSLASTDMIAALTAISTIPETAYAGLTNMFNALAGINSLPSEGGIFQWFTGDKTKGLTEVAGELPGVATDIASFFTNLGGRTDFSPISDLFNTLSNIEINTDVAEKGFWSGVSQLGSMGTELSTFATNAANFFSAVSTYSATTISDFFAAIGEGGDLPTKLEGLDGTIGTTLSNIATNVGTKMAEIKTKIETEINAIIATVKLKQTELYNSGVHIMEGLNAGIRSMKSTLMATARSIANSISGTLNSALKIHSPSKLTFETGQYLDMGMIGGMQSMIPDVKAAAIEVSNATIPYGGTYTPEGSATYYSSSGSSNVTTISPVFNLTVSGTQDDRATARRIKRYVAEAITETFESMERTGHLSLV